MSESLPETFSKFIEPEPNSGCWLWVGGRTETGYGLYTLGKQTRRAHRWAWMYTYGMLPENELDHLCRVRCCVNPKHLEIVTRVENMRRGVNQNKRKVACPQGHPYSHVSAGKRRCRTCLTQTVQRLRERRRGL